MAFIALAVALIAFVLLNLVANIFCVNLLGTDIAEDSAVFWLMHGAVSVFSVLSFVITWNFYKARANSTYSFSPRFRAPIVYHLGDAGFQFHSGGNTVLLEWSAIEYCYDFARVICFVSGGLIFPLPKRGFSSYAQLKGLRNFVRSKGVSVTRRGDEPATLEYSGEFEHGHTIIYDEKGKPITCAVVTDSAGLINLPINNFSQLERLQGDLQNVVDGKTKTLDVGHFKAAKENLLSPPHPQSSLIDEPSYVQAAGTVSIECNYTFEELRSIDRMLFFKFTFMRLSRDYILFVLFIGLVTFAVLALANDALALIPRVIKAQGYLGVAVLLWGVHVHHLLRVREAAIKDLIEHDQPIIVQLSDTLCTVRSRRSVMHYPLHYFRACLVTGEHYICVLPGGSVVIPRRAITSRVDAAIVEQLLKSSIKHYQDLKK